MTALAPSLHRMPALPQMLTDAALFTKAGLLLALSLIPTFAAHQIDPRLFMGEGIWIKPLKFQIALSLYLLTLAYFAQWLPKAARHSRKMRAYQIVVLLCIAAEMVWIGGAAAIGISSHFNTSPMGQIIYGFMGLFAVTLTSAALVWGVLIARNPATTLSPALHRGLSWGLILTFGLTVIAAGTMSSQPGHLIGQPITGDTLWLLGWSREVGDLRAAHFLATHAMHIIPAAALMAHLSLPPSPALRATTLAALGYAALTAWAFVTALMGLPLI
jgi:hypothetical protein